MPVLYICMHIIYHKNVFSHFLWKPRFRKENLEKLDLNLRAQYSGQAVASWLGFRLQMMGVVMVTGIAFISVLQHQFQAVNAGLWLLVHALYLCDRKQSWNSSHTGLCHLVTINQLTSWAQNICQFSIKCSQSNTLYFWKIFQNSINLTDFVRCSFNSPTLFSHSCPGLVGLALSYALSVTSLLSGVVSSFTETEKQLVSVERAQQYLNIPSENLQGSLLVNQSFLCRLN